MACLPSLGQGSSRTPKDCCCRLRLLTYNTPHTSWEFLYSVEVGVYLPVDCVRNCKVLKAFGLEASPIRQMLATLHLEGLPARVSQVLHRADHAHAGVGGRIRLRATVSGLQARGWGFRGANASKSGERWQEDEHGLRGKCLPVRFHVPKLHILWP